MEQRNFYFTFGSDPKFPFGPYDFVVVQAADIDQACRIFNEYHPPRAGSTLVNCAFIYPEAEFNSFRDKWYAGREPAEVIGPRRSSNGYL